MEMHLVHYKATHRNISEALKEGAYDSLAVLGVFFEVRMVRYTYRLQGACDPLPCQTPLS